MFYTSNNVAWPMKIIYILSLLIIARAVYRSFFTPLLTCKDYINRANQWTSYFRAHSRSIRVLQKAFSLFDLSTEEKNLLHLEIGLSYYRQKNFSQAVEEFRQMMGYFNQTKLPFSPHYASVIISFYNAGDISTARGLYHRLKKHENSDIKFNALTSLDTRIFK